jgi:hypothetical protein
MTVTVVILWLWTIVNLWTTIQNWRMQNRLEQTQRIIEEMRQHDRAKRAARLVEPTLWGYDSKGSFNYKERGR